MKKKYRNVEQGEYAVVPASQAVGTCNVHQCIVLYVKNSSIGVHGLAHIDGHVEIQSLNSFFTDLQIKDIDNYISIKIMGAYKDTIISGLNDADFNNTKLDSFLTTQFPGINFDECIIDTQNASDFLIDTAENVVILPNNDYEPEGQQTYPLQEMQRVGGYIGTYPIIRTDIDKLLLNERVVCLLQKYNQSSDYFRNLRLSNDPTDYSNFESSLLMLNTMFQKVTEINNESLQASNISPLEMLINQGNALISSNRDAIYKLNTALIGDAIYYCKTRDENINIEQFKADIYKEVNKIPHLAESELLLKSYGAQMSVGLFIDVLKQQSEYLQFYMMLNNQGGVGIDEDDSVLQYKISDVFECIDIVTKAEKIKVALVSVIKDSIVEYNKHVPTIVELEEMVTSLKHSNFLNKRQKILIQKLQYNKQILAFKKDGLSVSEGVEAIIKEVNTEKINLTSKQKSQVRTELTTLIQDKIDENSVDEQSDFSKIYQIFSKKLQDELEKTGEELDDFSMYSISKYLAMNAIPLHDRVKEKLLEKSPDLKEYLEKIDIRDNYESVRKMLDHEGDFEIHTQLDNSDSEYDVMGIRVVLGDAS